MNIFRNCNEIPTDFNSVVSTGTFDGVHKGHRAIIKRVNEIAEQHKLKSVIVTFEPHPRVALGNEGTHLKLLTTLDEKLAIFEELGIDIVFVIDFTSEFAAMPYEVYVKDFLVKELKAKYVVLGFNHHFGNHRSGNHDTLFKSGEVYGFQVEEVSEQTEGNIVPSSTKIRLLLEHNHVEEANILLSYNYSLVGKVVEGNQIGKQIGFPTANLKVADVLKQIPANGVYAVQIVVDNELFEGMCNIGNNPTFVNRPRSIEVHIFGFDRTIYGKNIKLVFKYFVRNEKKFTGVKELTKQLARDKKIILKKRNG
ncbi:MAG: bifunctional riboflavin kinase/FAD synthetase [Bacteroidota bacterium]